MVNSTMPFAQALLSIGEEEHKENEYGNLLEAAAKTVHDNPELANILQRPGIERETKEKIVLEVFREETEKDPEFGKFLRVVCRYSMGGSLEQISADYQRLLDDLYNIVNVKITSAAALNDKQKEKLQAALEKKLGSKVRMHYSLDPSLIAGLKIQTDDRMMDASVHGRLERMKEQLTRS